MELRKLFNKLANKDSTECESTDKHPTLDVVSDSSSVCLTSNSSSEPSSFMSIPKK